ncbi:MAG: hypothetical protein JWP29_3618 [Rhodoferax sp.]|nr:hypothetical protein [Rhodoferax sp.]
MQWTGPRQARCVLCFPAARTFLIDFALTLTCPTTDHTTPRTQPAAGAAALVRSALFDAVLASPVCAVMAVDLAGKVIACNQAFAAPLGHAPDSLRQADFGMLLLEDDRGCYTRLMREHLRTLRESPRIQRRFVGRGGGVVWFDATISALRDGDGRLAGFVGVGTDVTSQRQQDRWHAVVQAAFAHSSEAQLVSDAQNRIVAVNQAFTRLTGYGLDEVLGRNPRLLASGHTPRTTFEAMWAALAGHGAWQGEVIDRRKDGSVYPKWLSITMLRDAQGEPGHYLASFTDVSQQKASAAQIERLAFSDGLTGLHNRAGLQRTLAQVLGTARRLHQAVAVLSLDVDQFKAVNDSLGHDAGDGLLVDVARRLLGGVRAGDAVARLGGDEFVVVLADIGDAATAAWFADRILFALAQPYLLGERPVHSTASVGVALYPDDGTDGDTLLKSDDAAMYHAKGQGRDNVQFFTARMHRETSDRLQLDHELRVALQQRQFELHYQPQLDSRTGLVMGVEALVRWRHPERGLVPPMTFIPVAEANGLILPLGEWVLDEACRQLRAWRDAGVDTLTMSVNLSAHQLRSRKLLTFVVLTLEQHGLQGEDLQLEITESAVMEDPGASIGQLRALRDLGVRLSIDDFGTGHSSLSYLKLLPIHSLKLDKSFVHDIETDPHDVAICTATITLARNLGLTVVGEGVETEAQRHFLAEHLCDFLQGYLFCKPLPPAEALRYIQGQLLLPGGAP